jgi:putative transposase
VRRYRYGAHTKTDLKVHLVWVPKYRKKVLVEPVAIRVRDLIRQIVTERELTILSGKGGRDHATCDHHFFRVRSHDCLLDGIEPILPVSQRNPKAVLKSLDLRADRCPPVREQIVEHAV